MLNVNSFLMFRILVKGNNEVNCGCVQFYILAIGLKMKVYILLVYF